jgi:crotonobetainyl-CoA:carnitine CoA-transferase CaiB-like acyl-CoA transferase
MVSPRELNGPLMQPGPAYGDTIGGMNLAGGIAAALFHRERTGEALELDVSLLSSGVWATAASIDVCIEQDAVPFINAMPESGSRGDNPFIGAFICSDGGAINITLVTPGRYIRDTFEHLNLSHLADDPRFSTVEALFQNAKTANAEIVAAISKHPKAYWLERLSTMAGQWASYQSPLDVSRDSQVLASGLIFEVDSIDGSGKPMKIVANPVQFNHQPVANTRSPEASEHTELFLMELGLDWDRMEELKRKGVIA